MVGEIAPRHVDWEYGFTSFMYYGEDQWEISLENNSPVAIVALLGAYERDFDPPILGNTGSSGEDWHATCKETFKPRL